jgi:hypothetical protein
MSAAAHDGVHRALFDRLAALPDVDKLTIGYAIPHSRHLPGRAQEKSTIRERAFVVDGGSFVYVACCCGLTPFEVAEDLGIPRALLQPLAAEQARMLKLQARLQIDFQDREARELTRLLGLTTQQVLGWRLSDTGWPPELWGQESASSFRNVVPDAA